MERRLPANLRRPLTAAALCVAVLAVVGALNAVVSLYYYFKIARALYLRGDHEYVAGIQQLLRMSEVEMSVSGILYRGERDSEYLADAAMRVMRL